MSFRFSLDPHQLKVGRDVGRARRNLQKAFAVEKQKRKFTQAELARAMGVGRSVINRQLTGNSNLTLKSLAEWAYALKRNLIVEFEEQPETNGAKNEAPELQAPEVESYPTSGMTMIAEGIAAAAPAQPTVSVKSASSSFASPKMMPIPVLARSEA